MASSVSLRAYMLYVHERGKPARLTFDVGAGGIDLPNFISSFVASRSSVTEDNDKERSWNFEERIPSKTCNSKGIIQYGIHGFESRIIDTKTRRQNYLRKVTDSEIVPLYYEIWHPSKRNYILMAFQSFQGRSCVTLVGEAMQAAFEKLHPNYMLKFRKLMPTDSKGSIFRNNRVQKLTLIRRNTPTDIADRYSGIKPSEPVRLEISVIARRKGWLGLFGDIVETLGGNDQGLITYEGIQFDEAIANVRIGNQTRPVGIFGNHGEAGAIDLTAIVRRDADGHPNFASMTKESGLILKELHTMLSAST
jgi:hypothetical protein